MPVAPPDAVERAIDELGDLARRDVPLAPLTTYKVGGPADVFVEVTSPAQLHLVAAAHAASGLSVLVVGRGSNLLVADRGFGGIAVSLADLATEIEIDHDRSIVRAGSAVALPVLARRVASAGLTGFEWAVGVPGSIGGAVRMNAGGHGSDIAESLIDVTVFDLAASSEVDIPADQLGLRFRGSALPSTAIVVSARLQLASGDGEAARRELGEIVAWRRANQPGGQNAGSVFVNPIPHELSAGKLIDEVGLRGFRVGTAFVSDKHANFIQADPGGSADDVHRLMQIVRERVAEATGYELRSEIRLIGFDRRSEPHGGTVADVAPRSGAAG
ncbi:UDP-N-acetylmuramate dehydrogenase [Ilumatobacter nonamiensis]|uniref:UDP-N-acetylmuramate dehydrogenase n=1 Tax=Ilumatobacter nonamiensis TaxID=467093 RepID=UPI000347CFAE|nr:UDP-N-acetylmuramate dehydrogenase [Ilumatobacter nonamiensis]